MPRRNWALKIVVGVIAISVSAGTATAAWDGPIDANTPCAVAAGFFDNEDREHAVQAFEVIKRLMASLDSGFVARGHDSVIAPLSVDGASFIYLSPIAYCRTNPRQTLGQATTKAYQGLRAMQSQLGGIR